MSTNPDESSQVVDVAVLGLPGSGKSTLIHTISQQTQWHENGWLSGLLTIDEGLYAEFLEPPATDEFDFMWLRELVENFQSSGYMVIFDSTAPEDMGAALYILQTVRLYYPETPVVAVANKQDTDGAWSVEDMRISLGIADDIPIVPCISTSFDSVREAVLELLYRVLNN